MYSTIQLTLKHIHVTFEGKAKWFWRKNNLQTAKEWAKSYIELIASYVHLKTDNHLRSHLKAIMALDHSRLIRSGKKIRPNFFAFDKFTYGLLTKSCQQIWVRVNQPFIPFIHHIWGETVLWGTVFIIQTSDRKQYFTILHTHSIFRTMEVCVGF